MRTEDDFGAVVDGPIDCRQRRANASVIRNLMCIIEGDVEISSNDDALVSQYDIVDRLFAQSHGGSASVVLLGMEARVKHERAEAGIASQYSAPGSCRDHLDQISNPA